MTAGYTFASLPWSPNVTLGYQTFSGDDPDTTKLERFDPLYYQGSPSAWATGSKSASTFINSNVNALTLALRTAADAQDTWTLRYAHIRANELNSPVQFGQATRVDVNGNVVSGVTDAHLADDLFLEYSRIINRNTFLTAGVSVSFPGAGDRQCRRRQRRPMDWRFRECRRQLLNLIAVATGLAMALGAQRAHMRNRRHFRRRSATPRKWAGCRDFRHRADKMITQPDSVYFSFPRLRWSVCHLREFLPTEEISRGLGAPVPLSYPSPADFAEMRPQIDAMTFTP